MLAHVFGMPHIHRQHTVVWLLDDMLLLLCRAQALQAHELGLNSIWDVAWAPGAAAPNGNGSNGRSSSNGKSSLHAGQQASTNGGGAASSLGSSGKPASSLPAGAADAVAASNGGSSNGHQSSSSPEGGAEQQAAAPAPAPAQEGCEFTTWKFRSSGVAKRTIDYIWYTGAQLVPVSRWRMLSEAEIGPSGLPNTQYPSDHMAVTCQFGWVASSAGER